MFALVTQASAQFGDASIAATEVQKTQTTRWRVGMTVEAVGGACNGLFGTVPVPTDWPGQTVRVVEEDISPSVSKVRYRTIGGGVKQMLISIPRLAAGESAHAIVTFEVDRDATYASCRCLNTRRPKTTQPR